MKLIFVSGVLADNRYDVERDITIGRDVSNDIVIADPLVLRTEGTFQTLERRDGVSYGHQSVYLSE